jgi:hypothetical protein
LFEQFSSAKGKQVDWLGMAVDNDRVTVQLKEGNAALLDCIPPAGVQEQLRVQIL